MWPLCVVVRGVLGEHPAEVALPEDQYSVGEVGSGGRHDAFGDAVRLRAPRWDFDRLDACVVEHRVERRRELGGPVAVEEPEPRGAFVEVRQEVAGVLGGSRSVGVPGHAQGV
jgi:hypothetical protein